MEILQLSSRGNLNYPGGMRLWWFSRGAFLGEKYQPNERGSAAEIENPRYSLDPTLPLAPMTPSLHVIVLLLVALLACCHGEPFGRKEGDRTVLMDDAGTVQSLPLTPWEILMPPPMDEGDSAWLPMPPAWLEGSANERAHVLGADRAF